MSKILEIKNLHTSFMKKKKELKAIRGVDIEINTGEILGLVGESGSGKSITMKSIMGILPPNGVVKEGEIIFNNVNLLDIDDKDKRKLLGNDISMIFQDPMTALNPLKTIGYHLEEIILRHNKITKQEANKRAIEALDMVEIPNPEKRITQYPHEFSGGMRQRVVIAMALVNSPYLLIADEPTTALDVTIQYQILKLIKNLQEKTNMAVVLITHDLAVVYSICHRIIVMYGGKIMEKGLRNEIFQNSKHPYTKALLNSIPKVDNIDEKLIPIDGIAPTLDTMPAGCPFAPRCKDVMDICKIEMPLETSLSDTQKVRCHLYAGGSNE